MSSEKDDKNGARRAAAISYAIGGQGVFPVAGIEDGHCACSRGEHCHDAAGKHPLTNDGCKSATTDTARINKWWNNVPSANIGIATGAESALWVLDADGAHGILAVAELEAKYGPLPRTPIARTGGGGRHYYFAWPQDETVANSTKLCGLPLDVRGAGGYVLAPPSAHMSGTDYAWETSPDDAAFAPAPGWLLQLIATKQLPAVSATNAPATNDAAKSAEPVSISLVLRIQPDLDLDTDPGASEGDRHNRALALVGAALAHGGDADEILANAVAWANRCTPPMPEAEVRRIVADLTKKQQQQDAAASVWEPPANFYEWSPPPFPTDALSGWLREFVEAEAEATQTPADLPAMLCLATLAACCAKRVHVRINDGYVEPLNLFVAVALPPANRKSAVFSDVTAPLRTFEREEADRMAPEIAAAENEAKIAEARLSQLRKAAVDAILEEVERFTNEANTLAQVIADTPIPKAPRLLTSDVTPEALGTLLAEHSGRMAVMSPEGDVFDLMAGRYGHGTPNFGVYLQAHAGDDLRVDRKHRAPEFVASPALTVGVAVQPDVIAGLGAKRELRGRGLLARFLYSLPKSLVGERDVTPPAVTSRVRDAYVRNVNSLLAVEGDDEECHDLRLSAQAEAERVRFAAGLEPRLAPGADLETIQDWAGKLAGAVLRIAGILHMAEHTGEQAPWTQPISGATMRAAVRIGSYLVAHAHAAFALMGADPAIEDAKYVLDWIRRKGFDTFSERDAFEATKARFKKVDALRPALALLVSHGYIRPRASKAAAGRGRRPSPVYEVNPIASSASHNSQNSHNSQPVSAPPISANSAKEEGVDGERTETAPPISANSATSAKGVSKSRSSKPACILALEADDDTDAIPAEEEEFEEGTL